MLPGGGSHSRAEAVVPGPRSPSAPPAGPSFGLALSGLRSDLRPARGNWPQALGACSKIPVHPNSDSLDYTFRWISLLSLSGFCLANPQPWLNPILRTWQLHSAGKKKTQPYWLCFKFKISSGHLGLPASLHFLHPFYLFLSFRVCFYFTEKIEAERPSTRFPNKYLLVCISSHILGLTTIKELSLSLTPILPFGH